MQPVFFQKAYSLIVNTVIYLIFVVEKLTIIEFQMTTI